MPGSDWRPAGLNTEAAVRTKVGAVPEVHQPEHALLNALHPGRGVALKQPQFLQTLENPDGEIDLDAALNEDLAVELVRQSFASSWLI